MWLALPSSPRLVWEAQPCTIKAQGDRPCHNRKLGLARSTFLLYFVLRGVDQRNEGRAQNGNSTAKAKVNVPERTLKAGG